MIGPIAFFLGQLLPRENFDYYEYPYKSYKWEHEGMIYTKLKIQRWKDVVPDVSRRMNVVMRKRIREFRNAEYMDMLIRETCVAELVHWMLILLSPIYLVLVDGIAGVLGGIAYSILNLPFILIQRYNRPRLVVLREKQLEMAERHKKKQLEIQAQPSPDAA
ncbi:hypothetical protein LJC33_03845 [Eubacteriales bacterium OttesenSCG-928-N13]|nr:hypothetical protein [Eubacteriales bacterium OttesenSCG-928-N13]